MTEDLQACVVAVYLRRTRYVPLALSLLWLSSALTIWGLFRGVQALFWAHRNSPLTSIGPLQAPDFCGLRAGNNKRIINNPSNFFLLKLRNWQIFGQWTLISKVVKSLFLSPSLHTHSVDTCINYEAVINTIHNSQWRERQFYEGKLLYRRVICRGLTLTNTDLCFIMLDKIYILAGMAHAPIPTTQFYFVLRGSIRF